MDGDHDCDFLIVAVSFLLCSFLLWLLDRHRFLSFAQSFDSYYHHAIIVVNRCGHPLLIGAPCWHSHYTVFQTMYNTMGTWCTYALVEPVVNGTESSNSEFLLTMGNNSKTKRVQPVASFPFHIIVS